MKLYECFGTVKLCFSWCGHPNRWPFLQDGSAAFVVWAGTRYLGAGGRVPASAAPRIFSSKVPSRTGEGQRAAVGAADPFGGWEHAAVRVNYLCALYGVWWYSNNYTPLFWQQGGSFCALFSLCGCAWRTLCVRPHPAPSVDVVASGVSVNGEHDRRNFGWGGFFATRRTAEYS